MGGGRDVREKKERLAPAAGHARSAHDGTVHHVHRAPAQQDHRRGHGHVQAVLLGSKDGVAVCCWRPCESKRPERTTAGTHAAAPAARIGAGRHDGHGARAQPGRRGRGHGRAGSHDGRPRPVLGAAAILNDASASCHGRWTYARPQWDGRSPRPAPCAARACARARPASTTRGERTRYVHRAARVPLQGMWRGEGARCAGGRTVHSPKRERAQPLPSTPFRRQPHLTGASHRGRKRSAGAR